MSRPSTAPPPEALPPPAALEALAARVLNLLPSRRDPEHFHLERHEIAAELLALARAWPPASPPRYRAALQPQTEE